jgi:hypothetical protein
MIPTGPIVSTNNQTTNQYTITVHTHRERERREEKDCVYFEYRTKRKRETTAAPTTNVHPNEVCCACRWAGDPKSFALLVGSVPRFLATRIKTAAVCYGQPPRGPISCILSVLSWVGDARRTLIGTRSLWVLEKIEST